MSSSLKDFTKTKLKHSGDQTGMTSATVALVSESDADVQNYILEAIVLFIQTRWDHVIYFVVDVLRENNQDGKQVKLDKDHPSYPEYVRLRNLNLSLITLLNILSDPLANRLNQTLRPFERSKLNEILIQNHDVVITKEHMQALYMSLKKTFLTPRAQDKKLIDIISELEDNDLISFITSYPEKGAPLLNYLQKEQVAFVFDRLPQHLFQQVIESAGNHTLTHEEELFMIKRLEGFLSTKKSSFLAKNIPEIIQHMSPSKESAIIQGLIDQEKWQELEDTTKQFFPTHAFSEVEDNIRREFFQNLSLDIKVNFLAVQDDDERDDILDSYIDKESKAYELIDLELTSLLDNEIKLQQSLNQKDHFEKKFYESFRKFLVAEYPQECEQFKSRWLYKVKSSKLDSSSGHEF